MIALTSRSWVQIAATFDNFARLACRADKKWISKVRMIKHVCFTDATVKIVKRDQSYQQDDVTVGSSPLKQGYQKLRANNLY